MARVPVPPAALARALGAFNPTWKTTAMGSLVSLSCGLMAVEVSWPVGSNDAEFDFFKDGEPFYSDWIEYSDGESSDAQISDIVRIANAFFGHETRVAHGARFGGARQLEYNRDGRWLNMLFPLEGDDET